MSGDSGTVNFNYMVDFKWKFTIRVVLHFHSQLLVKYTLLAKTTPSFALILTCVRLSEKTKMLSHHRYIFSAYNYPLSK